VETPRISGRRPYAWLRRSRRTSCVDRFLFSLIETADRWMPAEQRASGGEKRFAPTRRECLDVGPTDPRGGILITELWQGANVQSRM